MSRQHPAAVRDDRGSAVPAAADGESRGLPFVAEFDGLRAIAVLFVVATHLRQVAPDWYGRGLPKGGFLGVDLFFVLSGFLITSLLLGEQYARGAIRIGAFFRRRALRLLPALALLLAAHVAYAAITDIPAILEQRSIAAVVTYIGNWKIVYADGWPPIAPGLAHLWSLAVEEQFYLLWPLVTAVALGRRRSLASVTAMIGTSILAVALWRIVLTQDAPRGVVYFRTDARADALLVGALAAHWWVRGRTPRIPRALANVSAVLLVAAALLVDSSNPLLFNGGFTIVAVAAALVLLAALDGDWAARPVLRTAPLRVVGRVSYGLYLWHFPVLVAVATHGDRWSVGTRLVVSGVLIVSAVSMSRRFVELPFLRWKDRLDRSARRPRVDASTP